MLNENTRTEKIHSATFCPGHDIRGSQCQFKKRLRSTPKLPRRFYRSKNIIKYRQALSNASLLPVGLVNAAEHRGTNCLCNVTARARYVSCGTRHFSSVTRREFSFQSVSPDSRETGLSFREWLRRWKFRGPLSRPLRRATIARNTPPLAKLLQAIVCGIAQ